jgi:hypothetical protein
MVIISGNTDTLQFGHYANGLREMRDKLDSSFPNRSILGLARWDNTMPQGGSGPNFG